MDIYQDITYLLERSSNLILNQEFIPYYISKDMFVFKRQIWNNNSKLNKWYLFHLEKLEAELLFSNDEIGIESQACPYGWSISGDNLKFNIGSKQYLFSLKKRKIATINDINPSESVSPNGNYAVLSRMNNLWIRKIQEDIYTQITFDGMVNNAYATPSEGSTHYLSDQKTLIDHNTIVYWSPDSRYFATYKLDERNVKPMYLLENVPTDGHPTRPIIHTYKYALPEDKDENQPIANIFIYNTLKKRFYPWKSDPFIFSEYMYFSSLQKYSFISWSKDSTYFSLRIYSRDFKYSKLLEVNAENGSVIFLDEEYHANFDFSSWHSIFNCQACEPMSSPECGKMIHYDNFGNKYFISAKDGWEHLYEIDREGTIKQITNGQWVVRKILFIDSERQIVYISVSGKDSSVNPYYSQTYALDLETNNLSLLTPEIGNHHVIFSPDGKYFTDFYSEPNKAPETLLKKSNGEIVSTFFTTDTKRYFESGFTNCETIQIKSLDENHILYGLYVPPHNVVEGEKYPLVEYVYGGPQITNVPVDFLGIRDKGHFQAFSKLGIATLVLDSRGTPYRGKNFHSVIWRDLHSKVCLEEHLRAIEQVCNDHVYIDRNRIGVWGHSAGGSFAIRLLASYPDTYKVGISVAGCHNFEQYLAGWSECFMNSYDSELWHKQDVINLVHMIRGKLFLIHGELDDNVHPSMTMRLIKKLINDDINFDMLLVPGANHYINENLYVQKRILDYFLKNL